MRPAGNRRPHPTVNTQSGRISGDRQEPRARNPMVHRIHALRPPARNRHCGRMDSALAGTDDARRRPGCTAGVRRSACAAFAPWLDDPPGQRARSRPVLRAAAFLAAPKSSDVPHVQRENRYRGKTVSRGSWKTWQRAASSLRVSATRRFTQFERWSPCPAGSERRSWRGYPTRRLAKQPYAKGQCECAQEHLRRRLVRRRRCHSTIHDVKDRVLTIGTNSEHVNGSLTYPRPVIAAVEMRCMRDRGSPCSQFLCSVTGIRQLRSHFPRLVFMAFPTDYRGRRRDPPMEKRLLVSQG